MGVEIDEAREISSIHGSVFVGLSLYSKANGKAMKTVRVKKIDQICILKKYKQSHLSEWLS